MKVNDWQRIEDLFHEALPLDANMQAEYLNQACLGNASLRAEVQSLLLTYKRRENFMEVPAFDLGMQVLSGAPIESLVGKQIGPYQILDQLGQGGMGEVYLAEDTRLGRRVALKFLSANLVGDNWANKQLVKEAQAAAMLEHPNICAIHGIELVDGYNFIVMQYVKGETLAALIGRQLPNINQTISLAVQIVSGVAEAHAHGIIHRDIKPRNIVVTSSGHVKVLDFGLAKTVQRKQGADTNDTGRLAWGGLVAGTVGYMSPEQLRAERLDFRSDVFSLGAVLYELVSGKKPFERNSDAEVISATLTNAPDPLTRGSNGIPTELSRLIFKCLEKKKEQRYSSASEVLFDLSRLQSGRRGATGWSQFLGTRAIGFIMLAILFAAVMTFAYVRSTRVQTLAVLPIVSSDPQFKHLSNGLTEDLINKLSRMSKLRVRALTLVSGYQGEMVDAAAVGRKLQVDAVLVGRVVREGELLVLQTSLIETSDGAQIWGETYRVRSDQVLDLQNQVSEGVTSNLALWLGESDKKELAARPTQNPEALSKYYQGRDLWENRNKDNIREIMDHFEKAIALDASYARPYAGLADCYVLLNMVSYGNMPTQEAMNKASVMALRALEIDPNLPEAHTSLGVIRFKFGWNWLEAERELRRAIDVNPDYAWAHYWLSHLLAVTGRWDEAIAESRLASDLAPFSPQAGINECRSLYYARQYEKAEPCFLRLLEKWPGNESAQYVLTYVYLQKGMYSQAISILEKIYDHDKSLAAAPLGFAYGRVGNKAAALRILSELQKIGTAEVSKGGYLPPQEEALIYIGLGDNDRAFDRLETSYRERFASVIYLATDPIYDSLRADYRFADLARRLNLSSVNPPG